MPELPEVETTMRGVEPHIVNKKVKELIVRQPSLRWSIPEEMATLIAGKKILFVERRAKYLLIHFTNGAVIVHLGMSGSLRIIKANEPPTAHDHVDLVLSNKTALRYHDPRRFGCWLWQEKGAEHKLLSKLGPEPLSELFDGEHLFQASRKRKLAVKLFIMSNPVVVGVGNIYANEALFMAGIRPTLAASRVSRKKYELLADCIKTVLADAIEMGGTTLRDFVGGDGKPGYFKQSLNVYGREGEDCNTCKTPLKSIRQGQRATVYCLKCQK